MISIFPIPATGGMGPPVPPIIARGNNVMNVANQTADATQVGGNHYNSKTIQPWHAMESWMTREEFIGYLRGNVIKYTARCNEKGGIEDLKKAQHYLSKLVEFIEAPHARIQAQEGTGTPAP